MLRMNDQRARNREAKPGTDREVSSGHRRGTIRAQPKGEARVGRLLCQQEYARQRRVARGLLRHNIARMTGLSRADDATGRSLPRHGAGTDRERPRFPTRSKRCWLCPNPGSIYVEGSPPIACDASPKL